MCVFYWSCGQPFGEVSRVAIRWDLPSEVVSSHFVDGWGSICISILVGSYGPKERAGEFQRKTTCPKDSKEVALGISPGGLLPSRFLVI